MNNRKSADAIVPHASRGGKGKLGNKLPGDYVAGFVDGEGCFVIVISKHGSKKLGVDARVSFQIELRDDDRAILESIQATLGCGRIYHLSYERYGWKPHAKLMISPIQDIMTKLIPFFQKYPLRAKKRHSFELFCQAAEIVASKRHLTEEGIEDLRNIRKNMNKYSKKSQGSARVRENRSPGRERSKI